MANLYENALLDVNEVLGTAVTTVLQKSIKLPLCITQSWAGQVSGQVTIPLDEGDCRATFIIYFGYQAGSRVVSKIPVEVKIQLDRYGSNGRLIGAMGKDFRLKESFDFDMINEHHIAKVFVEGLTQVMQYLKKNFADETVNIKGASRRRELFWRFGEMYQKRSSMISRYRELMAEYFVKEFRKQRFTEYQRPYLIEVESAVIRALFEALETWIEDFDRKMDLRNFLFSLNLEPVAGYGVGAVTTLYFEKFRFAMNPATILLSRKDLYSVFIKNLRKYLEPETLGLFSHILSDTYSQAFSSRGDIQFYMEDMLKRHTLNDLKMPQKMEKAVQEFSKHPDIVNILVGDTRSQIQDFRKQSKPITITDWDCKATWRGPSLEIQFYGKADLKLGAVRMARSRKQADTSKTHFRNIKG